MRERGEKTLSLIPLDLDGFLFSDWERGYKNQVLSRLAADFNGWEKNDDVFRREIDKLVSALRADKATRQQPLTPACRGLAAQ